MALSFAALRLVHDSDDAWEDLIHLAAADATVQDWISCQVAESPPESMAEDSAMALNEADFAAVFACE